MNDIDDTSAGPRHAVIVRRTPLAWRDADVAARAGTPHPRAASGLARLVRGGRTTLALVQDDAPVIAFVDPTTGLADALPLGAHDALGPEHYTKPHKPDLECCTALVHDGRTLVLAFGSGSTARRERVAIIDGDGDRDGARLAPAHGLYAALRDALGPDGLNVEGALTLPGADGRAALWLFQRGNGGATPGVARLDLAALLAHLDGGPAPTLTRVHHLDLGALDGVPLGFTDAAVCGDRVLWLGSAEASANTYDDGRVVGSVVGVLDLAALDDLAPLGAVTRATPPRALRLVERDGRAFAGKAEGLAPADEGRLWICVDPDDPAVPAELLEVALIPAR